VRVRDDITARAEPGTIVATKPALVVACGSGALEIRALKPAGKGRMDAAAWLNGARAEAGARLGTPASVESADARRAAPRSEAAPQSETSLQSEASPRTNTEPPRATPSDARDPNAKPPTKDR